MRSRVVLLSLACTAFAHPVAARTLCQAPGDLGTILGRVVLEDRTHPFERTLSENDDFGSALASLGDLNGDGLVEVAIGAPFDFASHGAVWIFSLGPSRTVAKYVKLGPVENLPFELGIGDGFGSAIEPLGDWNGDGIGDLAVSAPGDFAGAVYLLFLTRAGDVQDYVKVDDSSPALAGQLALGDRFGSALARLGDVDGNGVPELAVGAPRNAAGGKVLVLSFAPDHSLLGTTELPRSTRERFGSSLSALGDVDGSGTIDLAVGSRNLQEVLRLTPSGTVAARTTVGSFGVSVTGLGDLDGDGVPDLAAADADRVTIAFLNADGTPKATSSIAHQGLGGNGFGEALAAPGDLNSDGRIDLFVGAPGTDVRADNSGAFYLYDLTSNGTAGTPLRIDASSSGLPVGPTSNRFTDDGYGAAIAPLGDLNGDGFPDFAVGAPSDDDREDSGAVWIHFLRAGNDGTRVLKLSATQGGLPLEVGSGFGSSLANLGDMDGNGVSDLAVGAPGAGGAIWILHLRENGTVLAQRELDSAELGPDAPHPLGSRLASLGDLDGNGVTDLAVSSPLDPQNQIAILFLAADGHVLSQRAIRGADHGAVYAEGFGQSLAWMGRASASGKRFLAVGGFGRLWRLELDADGTVVSAPRRLAIGTSLGAIASVGDLDGNGYGDLATLQPGSRLITLELSGADWSLAGTATIPARSPVGLAGLGDLTGDGVPDLAAAVDFGGPTFDSRAVYLLQLGGIATAGFEHRDNADERPLENGRQIPRPHPGRTFVISSEGANLGATAFDSSPSGPNAGNDLCVDSGMVLLLQDSLAPTQTQAGIFDHPSDDPDGGRFLFDFPRRVRALSLELADLDPFPQEGAQVTLVDDAYRTRLYDVPAGWTGPFGSSAIRRLALDTLAPQPGAGPYPAEAFEAPGFDANRVVRIEVELFDGGALDDLAYDPYP